MADADRVTLSGGILELAGRLSEEDRQALVAILACAAPDEPAAEVEVEGFTMDDVSSVLQLRMQMTSDRRSQAMTILSNLLKKQSDTQDSITKNLK